MLVTSAQFVSSYLLPRFVTFMKRFVKAKLLTQKITSLHIFYFDKANRIKRNFFKILLLKYFKFQSVFVPYIILLSHIMYDVASILALLHNE